MNEISSSMKMCPAAVEDIHAIGRDVLGPIVHRWMLALDQYVGYFSGEDTTFLYCARAGLRIQELYDIYLAGLNRSLDPAHKLLWGSQIVLCKGVFSRAPARSASMIAGEYGHRSLRELTKGLLRNCPDLLEGLPLDGADLEAHGFNFPGWVQTSSPEAVAIKRYFHASSHAFDAVMRELTGTRKRVVLIDSGWQGTMQGLLAAAYPEKDLFGLYVGRIDNERLDPKLADQIIGLLFQAGAYTPAKPETAILLHRHLIETLLEPNAASLEEIVGGPADAVARQQIEDLVSEEPQPEHDGLYLGVRRYLHANAGLMPAQILSRHQRAVRTLERMLVNPSRREAIALAGKGRAADFGKDLKVPVLIDPRTDAASADERVQKSLWPQGQIALEFEAGIAKSRQDRMSGLADTARYFDPTA